MDKGLGGLVPRAARFHRYKRCRFVNAQSEIPKLIVAQN